MAQKQSYRITWENGTTTVTEMSATLPQARAYFIGQKFQFGDTDEHPSDLMLAATDVKILLAPTQATYQDDDALGTEYCSQIGCHECEGTQPESSEPNGYGCADQEAWIGEHAHLITGPIDPCDGCCALDCDEGCEHAKEDEA